MLAARAADRGPWLIRIRNIVARAYEFRVKEQRERAGVGGGGFGSSSRRLTSRASPGWTGDVHRVLRRKDNFICVLEVASHQHVETAAFPDLLRLVWWWHPV